MSSVRIGVSVSQYRLVLPAGGTGRAWQLLGAIALACLIALLASSSRSSFGVTASPSAAAPGPARLPSALRGAIDGSLAVKPVTSRGGVRLWWQPGGSVSLATRASADERVTLRPVSIGRAGVRASISAFRPQSFVFGSRDTTVALGAGVTASYRVTSAGIEQSFTLARRVAGAGPLLLSQSLAGKLRARVGADGAIAFYGPSGAALAYRGLRVRDATGRLLRSRLALAGGGRLLRIVVDDHGAAYPLSIDPTFLSLAGVMVLPIDSTPAATFAGTGSESLGSAVAVSDDGRTAVVGAPTAAGGDGAVYVYSASAGSWSSTPTATFTGSSGEALGRSVAVSADGQEVVAGAPVAASGAGAVALYAESSGGSWSNTPSMTFTGSSGEALGSSVGLSADGQTVVAGAPVAGSGAGAVALYAESSGSWSNTPSMTFTGSSDEALGSSVGLSADGQTVVAGAPVAGSGAGAVALYAESSGSWSNTPSMTFTGSSGEALGTSVAVSAGGQEVAAGAPVAGSEAGAVALYAESSGGSWSNTPSTTFTGSSGDELGSSVGLSGDGQTVVAGAPAQGSGPGSAKVYADVDGSWSNTPQVTLTAPSTQEFGYAAAASEDGQTVLVGAPGSGGADGTALVYGSIAGGWSASPVSIPPGSAQAGFNAQIAIGAYGRGVFLGDPARSEMSVYAVDQTSGNWIQTNDVSASTGDEIGASVALAAQAGIAVVGGPAAGGGAGEIEIAHLNAGTENILAGSTGESLGTSVAVSADAQTIVAGAPGANSGNGAVAVYQESGGSWPSTPTILLTGSSGEGLGSSVAVSADGQTIAAGASGAGSSNGAVVVFRESGGSWSNTPAATTLTGSGGEQLGYSLAVSADGQTVAAGAPGAGSSNGAVVVFSESGGSWSTTPAATTLTGSGGEQLGYSLALSADARTLVAGAPLADSSAGAAFLYHDADGSWSNTPTATFTVANYTDLGSSVALDPSGQSVLVLGTQNSAMFKLVPASTVSAAAQSTSYSPGSQSVTLSASVDASSLAAGTLGEGAVTFTLEDGLGNVVGTPVSGNVSYGSASVSYTLPAGTEPGTYTILASYRDSYGEYSDSSDNSGAVTVTPATTTTAELAAATAYSVGSRSTTLHANVTSAAGTVGEGTVTFAVKDGGTQIGSSVSAPVSAGAADASYMLPAGTSPGSYTIEASYSDTGGNFAASSDASQSLTVGVAGTAIAASPATATFAPGSQSVALSAAVSSPAGTVGEGSVTFTVRQGTTVIGAATTGSVAAGTAAVSYVLPAGTAAGTYTIDASYSDTGGAFAASSDTSRSLTVGVAGTAIAASPATGTFVPGSRAVALTAAVSSPAGTVGEGSVTFTVRQGTTVIGAATTGSVDAGTAAVSYVLPADTAAGTYTIAASYSDSAGNYATSSDDTQHLTLGQRSQTITFTRLSSTSAVIGESTSLSASGGDSGEPVQLGVDPASSPSDACSVSQTASGAGTVTYEHAGTCVIDATQAASANGNYAAAPRASQTVTIDPAATSTALNVSAHSLTVKVAVLAPAAGTPSGSVSFSVDGKVVGSAALSGGVATLTRTLPAGTSHRVAAVYQGTGDFTGSSASTTRDDPSISAHVSTLLPKSRFGWYRTAVRIRFTCRTNGAPLTGACPATVTLDHNGAGQAVTRSIRASNGGAATVVVSGIRIDRRAPLVRLAGARAGAVYETAPLRTCSAVDRLSGIASCTMRKRVRTALGGLERSRVSYTLAATNRAGNTKVIHGAYSVLGIYLKNVPYSHDVFHVRPNRTYLLVVSHSARPPRYVDAAPSPNAPAGNDNYLHRIGAGAWAVGVRTPLAPHGQLWQLGVSVAGRLHRIPIVES